MLNHATLLRLVQDMAPRIVGGQIQKIRHPDPWTVCLRVRRPGETINLILSCHPDAPRLAETDTLRPNHTPASTVVEWLRATAKGRRLCEFTLDAADRVLRLVFTGGGLILELTGRATNLIAFDEEHRVVALGRRSPRIRVGDTYQLPPVPTRRVDRDDGRSALEIEAQALAAIAETAANRVATARARLLRRAKKKWTRLRDKVEQDLVRSASADVYRRQGELLKTQLYLVEKGASEVWLQDWYAPDTPRVRVELDPKRDGPANVARLFQRYRKANAGAARAAERKVQVDQLGTALQALTDETLTNEVLEERLVRMGLIQRATAPKAAKGKPAVRRPYRLFTSVRDERILVGRGGADNHETTFRVARGNDHWLHVRDAPGAHVVVPLPNRRDEPHPETLVDAAALAVHHSDLRGEIVVDVTHTRRKHVHAIKGGAPGRVRLSKTKTLTVTDIDARIRRLYEQRPG